MEYPVYWHYWHDGGQSCSTMEKSQIYVHISLEWPRKEDHEGFLEKLDLSCMNSLRVKWAFSRLPSSISTNLIQITNLQLHDILFFDEFWTRLVCLFTHLGAVSLHGRSFHLIKFQESKNSILDVVNACTHLVQLELPTEWKTKERDFGVWVFCTQNLQPSAITNGK